jgi:hypothetical protein
MIERFFLDRIDTESTRTTVADQLYFIVEALAHVAEPALSFTQVAVAWAQVALQASILETVPVAGCNNCILHSLDTEQIKGEAFGLY